MMSADGVLESGEPSGSRPESLKKMHLPGKTTPTGGGGCSGGGGGGAFTDSSSKVTANGVHDIEDRILRITGYYGYNPGYSSHRSEYRKTTVKQSVGEKNAGGRSGGCDTCDARMMNEDDDK